MYQQLEAIISNINALRSEGDITEVRILNSKNGTISGYFDDPKKLAKAIQSYLGVHNIYMTLNPVSPEILARSANRLTTYCKQVTNDSEIDRLEFLMIDLDPKRKTGIAATDEEHEAARQKAIVIMEFLREQGFPEPLLCDSGNGYHILYYIQLINSPENVVLLKTVLAALDFLFSDETVEVDRTTYNPSRITRLYGTKNCKGDNLPDRPHRISGLVEGPEEFLPVAREQLEAIAAYLPQQPPKTTKQSNKGFSVEEWLTGKELAVANQGPFQNQGTKYILEKCPWNPDHTNKSAYVIQFTNGAIAAGCLHNSCQGQTWQTLRAMYEENGESDKEGNEEKQADMIIRLGSTAQYFVDDLEEPHAAVEHEEHTEVLPIRSKKFQLHLVRLFYEKTGTAPAGESMTKALKVLEMMATFSNCERKLQRRVTMYEGSLYYDLTDKNWRAVRVTPQGCQIEAYPPILFTRSKNMATQVEPDFTAEPAQLFAMLQQHFRFKNQNDLNLFVVYLVACFVPSIAHVLLVLFGEKGAAKSTTMRMIKELVDPAMQDLLSMPTSKTDLVLVLANNYMPAFDNLESLSPEKSDLLCMAATGGAFSKRTLYSDADETILRFQRCVAVNGINVIATRADLLDRSVVLELERIPRDQRKTEAAIWQAFEQAKPQILGAIFNTLSLAMTKRDKIELEETGRMADFTYWGYAIAEVMGLGGEQFLKAYLGNQDRANEEALASHPVAAALIAFLTRRMYWSGGVSQLLGELEIVAESERINTRVATWPKDASGLSRRLNEVKSNLEDINIYYDIRHGAKFKILTLEKRSSQVDDLLPDEM